MVLHVIIMDLNFTRRKWRKLSQVLSREWHSPLCILNNNTGNEPFLSWELGFNINMGRGPNNKCISSLEKKNVPLLFPYSPQILINTFLLKCVFWNLLMSQGHISNPKYLPNLPSSIWGLFLCSSVISTVELVSAYHSFIWYFCIGFEKVQSRIRFLCLLYKTLFSWGWQENCERPVALW